MCDYVILLDLMVVLSSNTEGSWETAFLLKIVVTHVVVHEVVVAIAVTYDDKSIRFVIIC